MSFILTDVPLAIVTLFSVYAAYGTYLQEAACQDKSQFVPVGFPW